MFQKEYVFWSGGITRTILCDDRLPKSAYNSLHYLYEKDFEETTTLSLHIILSVFL